MQMKWTKDAADPECTVYKCGPWEIEQWATSGWAILWVKGMDNGLRFLSVWHAKREAKRITAAFERWFAKAAK